MGRSYLPTSGEETCFAQLRDDIVDCFGGQVVVIFVVEAHHRRELACPQALDLLIAEEEVWRYLVGLLHTDRLLQAIHDLDGASKHAAEVCADVETMLADRLEVKERIEGRDAFDVTWVELQRHSHLAHRLGCEVAELVLRQVQRGHDGRPRLWVLRGELFDLFEHMSRQSAHLSQSPSTVSAVPMMATMSARKWFRAMRSSACKLTNDAERNFTRLGLCVPSLAM